MYAHIKETQAVCLWKDWEEWAAVPRWRSTQKAVTPPFIALSLSAVHRSPQSALHFQKSPPIQVLSLCDRYKQLAFCAVYHTALFRVVSDVTPRLRTKLSVLSIYWVKIGTVEGILASVGQVLSIPATFMADLDEIRMCARKALLFYICSCTLKPYDIVKVKNASIKSVHYARKYTICSRAVGTDISKFVSLPELRRRPVCLLTAAVSSYRACLPVCLCLSFCLYEWRLSSALAPHYRHEAGLFLRSWLELSCPMWSLRAADPIRHNLALLSVRISYWRHVFQAASRLHVSVVIVVYAFFHAFYMHCQSHDHWFDIPIVYI